MLDVIADFWKPVKKIQQQERLQEEQLQIGSSIGFGFVPQGLLSGRRLTVSAINTYQFGAENLTSYVLSQDREPSVSMIVADADGEQYLAISRRVPLEERGRLFDTLDLESSVSNPDSTRLACKDNVPDFKSWLVISYKREIHGMKGRLFKGDHRRVPLPATSEGQDFTYTLLVSDSNEHALEIEKYIDGRLEVYATIYRRINDVGEISHPLGEIVARPDANKPDIKLATKRDDVMPVPAAISPATVLLEPVVVPKPPEAKVEITAEAKVEVKAETKTEAVKAPKAASITMQAAQFIVQPETSKVVLTPVTTEVKVEAKLQEARPAEVKPAEVKVPEVKVEAKPATPVAAAPVAPAAVVPTAPVATPAVKTEVKPEAPEAKAETKVETKIQGVPQAPQTEKPPVQPVAAPVVDTKQEVVAKAAPVNETPKEIRTMSTNEAAAVNGVSHDSNKPTLYVHSNSAEAPQSVRAVSRPQSQFENDSIECDLRVANKLIDEAIRNEMRLNDVVRRVIELPVANPESVQIPVTLNDDDYALLAIRYGIPAADRNAIKRRIIEDLNDFSGEKKA